ncbi:glycosyltransferase [Peribacillus simplex]|uniref:glycosyltransferase n=1 Tax=Peribacillus simplex TaxID=1478 RepID=UPI003CEE61A9
MEKNLKKICFLVDMQEGQKTGLFNATYQRINGLLEYINNYEIYSLSTYDGKLYSFLKKILKKEISSKGVSDSFFYEKHEIKYVYIKNTIFTQILKKIGCYYPIITALKFKKNASKFQMICAHWGFPQGGMAFILSKILNIPFSVTYHGSDIHSLPFKYKYFYNSIIKVLNESDLNIFVSENLMEFSIKRLRNLNKNNVTIVNTVSMNHFSPLQLKEKEGLKFQLNFKNKIVGYVGNLLEVKGADRLPDIFKSIDRKHEGPIDFLVIGDGDLFSLIKNKCQEYNLNITFLGKLEPEEVSKYMNIIDVLVLPSRQESFGLVILEANLCGTIAVATNTGGIPESIGNPKLLVEDNEKFIENISDKVVSIMKHSYCGNNLRERVIKNFDPKIAYEKEYNLLNKLYKNKMRQE